MDTENGLMRPSSQLAALLRDNILSGKLVAGDYLPSVRQLSELHSLAPKTVHTVLKRLADEGLIAAEPRHGYRVLTRAHDPDRGCPVAYMLSLTEENKDSFHTLLFQSLQHAIRERSWSLLGVNIEDRTHEELMDQLKTAHVWGVLMDSVDLELIREIEKAGISVVMIDAWTEDAPFDSVLQDNYQGGVLAGSYLINKGHREIAWVGTVNTFHARERFGGAAAALAGAGLEIFPSRLRCDSSDPSERISQIRNVFSSGTGPHAFIALWSGLSIDVYNTARDMGLTLGRDYDLVGWCTKQLYDLYRADFENGSVPPVITWDLSHMANTAITRLMDRRRHPDLPPMRLKVKTELRTGKNSHRDTESTENGQI